MPDANENDLVFTRDDFYQQIWSWHEGDVALRFEFAPVHRVKLPTHAKPLYRIRVCVLGPFPIYTIP